MKSIVISAAALAVLVACTPPVPTGAELYQDNCASCHGVDARGGAGDVAGKPPSDLTTLAKRHRGVFPTEYVMSTIDGYSRDVTHGGMPPFGELLDSEMAVWTDAKGVPTPTPSALILLAEYLEGLQI